MQNRRCLSERASSAERRLGWVIATLVMAAWPGAEAIANPAWARLDVGRGEALRAVAIAANGAIAVADAAGVTWWGAPVGASAPERAVLPSVNDVAFARDGRLWIATDEGLHRWAEGARPVRERLRGGTGTERIARLALYGDGIAVATAIGAYWSSDGEIFQPLAAAGIGAEVDLVAAAPRRSVARPREPGAVPASEAVELWLSGARGLQRIAGRVTSTGLRITANERVALSRLRSEAAPVDLHVDAASDEILLVHSDAIESRPRAGAQRPDLWSLDRPVLAPGAQIRRIATAPGRVVLATDRGLFAAPSRAGPFRRVVSGPGAEACADVDVRPGGRATALCRSGVWNEHDARFDSSGLEPRPLAARPERGFELAPDPPLAEIRARALARAGLTARRAEGLWSGLRRRGWWPDVALQAGTDIGRDERRFADQSFVSGDFRHLFDRTREREIRYEASIHLDWSLGELAYPEESVDLSRELRQVVSLRDDVADEIHQLYFERQRLRARLAADGPLGTGEAEAMVSRAREIAAGLDAWTGGWLRRWQADALGTPFETPSPRPPGSDSRRRK